MVFAFIFARYEPRNLKHTYVIYKDIFIAVPENRFKKQEELSYRELALSYTLTKIQEILATESNLTDSSFVVSFA